MEVLERGYVYALRTHEAKRQTLEFVKSLPEGSPDNHDGVLCQEVLRALIDRVLDLNNQAPCYEIVEIVEHFRDALILFEQRAFRRSLGKSYALTGQHVERLPVKENGHLYEPEPPVS